MLSFAIATRLVIYMEQKIACPNEQFSRVLRPSGLPYRTILFLLASLAAHISTTPYTQNYGPIVGEFKFPSVSEIGSWLRRGVWFGTGNAETPFGISASCERQYTTRLPGMLALLPTASAQLGAPVTIYPAFVSSVSLWQWSCNVDFLQGCQSPPQGGRLSK